jgi:hypothetical protein
VVGRQAFEAREVGAEVVREHFGVYLKIVAHLFIGYVLLLTIALIIIEDRDMPLITHSILI